MTIPKNVENIFFKSEKRKKPILEHWLLHYIRSNCGDSEASICYSYVRSCTVLCYCLLAGNLCWC